jgi:hypothetical protein
MNVEFTYLSNLSKGLWMTTGQRWLWGLLLGCLGQKGYDGHQLVPNQGKRALS